MKLPSIFRLAKQSSYQSDHRCQVGAAVVHKKTCMSYGRNYKYKTHPIMQKFHPTQTIHAELDAIISCKNKEILKDCIMVVYREGKQGELRMAKPCSTCQQILKLFKIKEIAYTTNGGYCIEQI